MTKPLSASELAALAPIAVLDRSPMALAVALATLAVDKREHIPIMGNLRLRAAEFGLEVIGGNLDVSVTARVAGAADQRLDTTVPAHMLKKIMDKTRASDMVSLKAQLPSDDVEKLFCNVDLGGVIFDVAALPASDYPEACFGDVKRSFEISGADLAAIFDKTRKAISTDETRYYLNGAYLHGKRIGSNYMLRSTTTDGHRMEVMEIAAPEGAAADWGVIVPREAVELVLDAFKLLKRAHKGSDDPPVTVEINNGSRIRFHVGIAKSLTIMSKLIDCTFPDYERVIPRSNGNIVAVSVKAMTEAIGQVSLIRDASHKSIKLAVSASSIELSANDLSNGRAKTTIAASLTGDGLEIGFNSEYLLTLLSEISGEECQIAFGDHGAPARFTDPGDSRWSAVLMPMRV